MSDKRRGSNRNRYNQRGTTPGSYRNNNRDRGTERGSSNNRSTLYNFVEPILVDFNAGSSPLRRSLGESLQTLTMQTAAVSLLII